MSEFKIRKKNNKFRLEEEMIHFIKERDSVRKKSGKTSGTEKEQIQTQ